LFPASTLEAWFVLDGLWPTSASFISYCSAAKVCSALKVRSEYGSLIANNKKIKIPVVNAVQAYFL
jgi:hypothetical protein